MKKKAKKKVNRKQLLLEQTKRLALAASYSLLTLLLAISIAWVVLAKQNFLFGLWHDHGGIAEGINTYGPENRYKTGFGETSRAERLRLFAAINTAVHRGGAGLEQITYQSPALAEPQRLLREPEVVHLQDVANLIDKLVILAMVALVLWLGVCAYQMLVCQSIPKASQQLIGLGIWLLPVFAGLAIIGPVSVFNTLHEWVFPDGHQWFFYYQDSLMSTLMLAPRLFGWIAAAIGILALAVYALLQLLLSLLLRLVRR